MNEKQNTTSNTPDSKQSQAPVLVDRNAVLDAVALFCANFDTLGERFKKQLRNTIRAVPRASIAAVEGDAERIAETTTREYVAKSLMPDDGLLSGNDYWQRAKGAEMVLERIRAAASSSSPASPEPTPEQIVYNVAQRDPFFRKHLIEQLSAMGDEQDTGPLKTLPAQPEGEQEPPCPFEPGRENYWPTTEPGK